MTDAKCSRLCRTLHYADNNVVKVELASVVEESWLEIFCNGFHVATLASSPFDIRSLVIGHLYFRGLVEDQVEIKALETRWSAERERVRVDVRLIGESAEKDIGSALGAVAD
jgi:formate dehydrogenase assembly factor FdhD